MADHWSWRWSPPTCRDRSCDRYVHDSAEDRQVFAKKSRFRACAALGHVCATERPPRFPRRSRFLLPGIIFAYRDQDRGTPPPKLALPLSFFLARRSASLAIQFYSRVNIFKRELFQSTLITTCNLSDADRLVIVDLLGWFYFSLSDLNIERLKNVLSSCFRVFSNYESFFERLWRFFIFLTMANKIFYSSENTFLITENVNVNWLCCKNLLVRHISSCMVEI